MLYPDDHCHPNPGKLKAVLYAEPLFRPLIFRRYHYRKTLIDIRPDL